MQSVAFRACSMHTSNAHGHAHLLVVDLEKLHPHSVHRLQVIERTRMNIERSADQIDIAGSEQGSGAA